MDDNKFWAYAGTLVAIVLLAAIIGSYVNRYKELKALDAAEDPLAFACANSSPNIQHPACLVLSARAKQ